MPTVFFRPFFKWCDSSMLGAWVRSGTWQFPMIETIHILALALLYGCVVMISLRLMHVLMRGWKVSGIASEVNPYLNWSLATILVSGAMLYSSEAMKTIDNPAFWIKIVLLFSAIIFHFAVVRPMARADEVSGAKGFVVGFVSLVLWLGIGCAGRAIAFV
jgi:hypothetical protein